MCYIGFTIIEYVIIPQFIYCALDERFVGFQIVASRTVATKKLCKTQALSKTLDQTLL